MHAHTDTGTHARKYVYITISAHYSLIHSSSQLVASNYCGVNFMSEIFSTIWRVQFHLIVNFLFHLIFVIFIFSKKYVIANDYILLTTIIIQHFRIILLKRLILIVVGLVINNGRSVLRKFCLSFTNISLFCFSFNIIFITVNFIIWLLMCLTFSTNSDDKIFTDGLFFVYVKRLLSKNITGRVDH